MKRLGCVVVLLFLITPLYGDVLLSAPNALTNPISFWPVGNGNTLVTQEALQFSLSGTSFVSTLDLTLYTLDGNSTYSLSLVSALTGPATTYATFTFGANCCEADPHTVTLNQTLNAGTYYLVLGTNSIEFTGGGWQNSDGTLVQNAGTIANGMWKSIDGGATWIFHDNTDPNCFGDCFAGVFTLNGTAETPVPEPTSLALMGSGLIGLGGSIRRKVIG